MTELCHNNSFGVLILLYAFLQDKFHGEKIQIRSWKVPRGEVQLDEVEGSNASGEVLKENIRCTRIAVKRRYSEMSSEGVELFKQEIVIMAQLQHQNVVKFIATVVDDKHEIYASFIFSSKTDTFR